MHPSLYYDVIICDVIALDMTGYGWNFNNHHNLHLSQYSFFILIVTVFISDEHEVIHQPIMEF
jgi:hypothetical protein